MRLGRRFVSGFVLAATVAGLSGLSGCRCFPLLWWTCEYDVQLEVARAEINDGSALLVDVVPFRQDDTFQQSSVETWFAGRRLEYLDTIHQFRIAKDAAGIFHKEDIGGAPLPYDAPDPATGYCGVVVFADFLHGDETKSKLTFTDEQIRSDGWVVRVKVEGSRITKILEP